MPRFKPHAPAWTVEEDAELVRQLSAAPDRGQEAVYAEMTKDPVFRGRTFYALKGRAQKLRDCGLLLPRAKLRGSKRAAQNVEKAKGRLSPHSFTKPFADRVPRRYIGPVLARPAFFNEPGIERLLTARRA